MTLPIDPNRSTSGPNGLGGSTLDAQSINALKSLGFDVTESVIMVNGVEQKQITIGLSGSLPPELDMPAIVLTNPSVVELGIFASLGDFARQIINGKRTDPAFINEVMEMVNKAGDSPLAKIVGTFVAAVTAFNKAKTPQEMNPGIFDSIRHLLIDEGSEEALDLAGRLELAQQELKAAIEAIIAGVEAIQALMKMTMAQTRLTDAVNDAYGYMLKANTDKMKEINDARQKEIKKQVDNIREMNSKKGLFKALKWIGRIVSAIVIAITAVALTVMVAATAGAATPLAVGGAIAITKGMIAATAALLVLATGSLIDSETGGKGMQGIAKGLEKLGIPETAAAYVAMALLLVVEIVLSIYSMGTNLTNVAARIGKMAAGGAAAGANAIRHPVETATKLLKAMQVAMRGVGTAGAYGVKAAAKGMELSAKMVQEIFEAVAKAMQAIMKKFSNYQRSLKVFLDANKGASRAEIAAKLAKAAGTGAVSGAKAAGKGTLAAGGAVVEAFKAAFSSTVSFFQSFAQIIKLIIKPSSALTDAEKAGVDAFKAARMIDGVLPKQAAKEVSEQINKIAMAKIANILQPMKQADKTALLDMGLGEAEVAKAALRSLQFQLNKAEIAINMIMPMPQIGTAIIKLDEASTQRIKEISEAQSAEYQGELDIAQRVMDEIMKNVEDFNRMTNESLKKVHSILFQMFEMERDTPSKLFNA